MRDYNRSAAMKYAQTWALGRNPRYYDYSGIGGDCTNFASQCLYAGCGVMDYRKTFGWYYINANDKAPAWTGTEYLYLYLTRKEVNSVGPMAELTGLERLVPGDLIQVTFDGVRYTHTLVVMTMAPEILISAHSEDSFMRPLSSYDYKILRPLHIIGIQ